MRGGFFLVLLLLPFAGCVSPAASLDAGSLALDPLGAAIPDATSTRLPNGDLVLTLAGEIVGSEEHEFDVPEGVTYVEAVVTSAEGPVSTILANADTLGTRCVPQTWSSWAGRAQNGMSCRGIAAVDPGAKWLVRVSGGSFASDPLDVLPVAPPVAMGGMATPVPYELTLTFSMQPLDGPMAAIKLDALSRPVYEAMEIEMLEVPASSDGAGLHVELTRPKTDEKVPVMLRASPYNGPAQNSQGRAAGAFVDFWVARGYAVGVMDLRGTGKSDGCFSMRAEVDETDIATVVEFLGGQDWSNGKVGMSGASYEGYTPAAAAVQAPSHLAAIQIIAPALDTWSNYLPGGVQTGRSLSTVAAYTTGNAMLTPSDEMPPDSVLHTIDGVCDPTIFPKGNDPRNLYDAWYAERNLTEKLANIKAPVLFEQGFWDNNVKANNIPDFFNALTVEKRGIFGSWQHISAIRADQQLRTLAWFDHFLKGADTGILDTPTMEVLTNTRQWRAGEEWPPTDASYVEFEVLPSGAFSQHPPALPFYSAVDGETPVFNENLYWTGVGEVRLDVTMPLGGVPQLEARVFEVQADEGEEIFASVGWINGAHVPDHTTYAPFAPGETRTLTLKLLPQDHVVQPGSTLRLELAAATDGWGGPESGLGATPGSIEVSGVTLRLPTLPYDTLSPQPRSAS